MFRSFTIRNFGIQKYQSFYIWAFQILTPTPIKLSCNINAKSVVYIPPLNRTCPTLREMDPI